MKREEQIRNQATNYGYAVAGGSTMRPPVSKAFLEGAKWADANQPSPWISVEDRLPEVNKDGESIAVFVRVINKHTKEEWIEQPARYNANIKDWIAMDFTHICKRDGIVTHWMEIPKLQEE